MVETIRLLPVTANSEILVIREFDRVSSSINLIESAKSDSVLFFSNLAGTSTINIPGLSRSLQEKRSEARKTAQDSQWVLGILIVENTFKVSISVIIMFNFMRSKPHLKDWVEY